MAADSGRSSSAWKRAPSIAVSLIILALLYRSLDLKAIGAVLGRCDRSWMVVALLTIVPIKLISAWRLDTLMPAGRKLGWAESNRLILVADVMNLVLPSKTGDVAKAYFMRQRGHLGGSAALSLVLVEKAYDMLALLLYCAVGLALYPDKSAALRGLQMGVVAAFLAGGLALHVPALARLAFATLRALTPARWLTGLAKLEEAWRGTQDTLRNEPARLTLVAAQSLLLWLVNFLQIWLFTVALRAQVPFLANLALAPLAILAGLVPLTFTGLGTRDAAIVSLYHPFMDPATGAAVGLLCATRYLLPAAAGLPFFRRYLEELRAAPR